MSDVRPRSFVGLWFGVVFVGALLALVWQSTYTFNDFAMQVTLDFTLANYRALLAGAHIDIVARTVAMAVAVTIACAILGFPLAYYMARLRCRMVGRLVSGICPDLGRSGHGRETRRGEHDDRVPDRQAPGGLASRRAPGIAFPEPTCSHCGRAI